MKSICATGLLTAVTIPDPKAAEAVSILKASRWFRDVHRFVDEALATDPSFNQVGARGDSVFGRVEVKLRERVRIP